MDFLQNLQQLYEHIPILSALLLGFMTAISPCPLATNITAIAFISKNIEDKRKVFINGIIYTLGRAITYVVIGVILFFGASQFNIQSFFTSHGEMILGPILLIIGVFMLDIIQIKLPGIGNISEKFQQTEKQGSWASALIMGILFALAFCPYSGLLYFGGLIPMTISSASGLYLPLVFAIATGLPVIIFAYLLAYTVSGVGSLYNNLKTFEFWFRRVVAVIFIIVGLYYIWIFFI